MFAERIFGCFSLLISLFYFAESFSFEPLISSGPVGPKAFPMFIGIGLILCSIIFIIKPDRNVSLQLNRQLLAQIAVLSIFIILYLMAYEWLGFLLASLLLCAGLLFYLGVSILNSVVFAVLFSSFLYFLFYYVLELTLSNGLLDYFLD